MTTEHDVWGVSYADRSLEPGQQATYRVIAVDGGTRSGESAPVTAARLLQDWTEPIGARTESLEGVVDPGFDSDTPFLRTYPPTLILGADGAPDDIWVTVARPNPANDNSWVDHDVHPGMTPSYRIILLAQDGFVSDPSEPIQVRVPTAGLVWPEGQGVLGGSHPEDLGAVSIMPWPDSAGYFVGTGLDVSPDRNHLALTTYTNGTNANRLLLTDVSGASIKILDANTNGNAGFSRPFFSPDGKRLAYVSGGGVSLSLSVLDIATQSRKDVLNQGVLYGWSPDGTKVLLADGINKYGDPMTGRVSVAP